MQNNNRKIYVASITSGEGLDKMEQKWRKYQDGEIISFAKNTPFREIAERVIPDRDGPWVNPLFLFESKHVTTIGADELCRRTMHFLTDRYQDDISILSISSGIEDDSLSVIVLLRAYGDRPRLKGLYEYLGETDEPVESFSRKSRLIIPNHIRNSYTEEQIAEHEKDTFYQDEKLLEATEEAPFLNSLEKYTKRSLPEYDEREELIYDLLTKDMQISTILGYKEFIKIFNQCMQYITSVERDSYYEVIRGRMEKDAFMDIVSGYINRNYVLHKKIPNEDVPALLKKLERSLFELYIVQDLIDDDDITDIKITAYDSIRVRVKGKAYLSNVTFIDHADYIRFVTGVAVRNNIDLTEPTQTFTDDGDPRYILRFLTVAPYLTGTGLPIMHIRKVPRDKLMGDDLIQKGMFDEKIRDYLLDCGKYSRGVVFAGPPGSGKTVCLNWFLEDAYESSAEILVIQENDELFAYRKGVMFEHVVNNPMRGEKACTLEQLGQMALVAGANVFVIGEAKGAEICSAITLSNSGCRTAITIHSPSATETIDKMADLAMRGYATSYDQAKRMIKSFQTIVYLQDFKVQEITEIIGYNDETKDMIYRPIYRRRKE